MAEPQNPNVTKSTKFAAAVANATGRTMEVAEETQALIVLPPKEQIAKLIPVGFGEIMQPFTADELALDMAKGELEWAPRILPMIEGAVIAGILEGRGPDVELDEIDKVTRTVSTKKIGSWIVRHPRTGLRASFLTAAQLETKLPPFVGGLVKIYVGQMLESKKGHRYRDYLVGGEKRADGPRDFTKRKAVIDVGAQPEDAIDLTDIQAAANDRSNVAS
jgi:hypothetical protein